MTPINRQKFLAELSKLLTFMYEEDRLYAMEMYERMFDIAEDDEQSLIQHLMSPTRQAVVIARAYNAKERKLSVESQSKDDDYLEEDGTPPFVLAINKIFDDLFPDETDHAEPVEDQVSFFELGEMEEEAPKRPQMPKAAVLLDNTQEFHLNLTENESEEMPDQETWEEQNIEFEQEFWDEPEDVPEQEPRDGPGEDSEQETWDEPSIDFEPEPWAEQGTAVKY